MPFIVLSSHPWVSPINFSKLEVQENGFKDDFRNYNRLFDEDIFDFVHPQTLNDIDQKALDFYEGRSDDYDKYLHLTFKTYEEDEDITRNKMIDLLNIKGNSKVLEIACGTGRDSKLIEKRLNSDGELCLTDISGDMLSKAYKKLNHKKNIFFCTANAMHMPFPNNYFDSLYSFGGLGEFSDPSLFFKEAVRVCKKGATIVVGDENLPIWQRETIFGQILSNYNKQFLAEVPFNALPKEAREVKCEWIIGGVFYLISFKVGEGEPYANFDFQIPGKRGGTHKTRFYGNLEGVSESTKLAALQAREKLGISMHEWLDKIIKEEAEKIINEE